MDFPTIFSFVHAIIACLGMIFNLLLIYLAIFQTPRVIRSYATLIVNFAFTDFCACLFDLFVQQRIIPAGLTLGYVSNGFCKYFGPNTCYIGYSLMLHFLSHSLWSLLLSFSYRFYILFKPAPSRHVLILLVFFIYIPSLFQWISFLWAQDDPKEIMEILNAKFPSYDLTGHVVTGTKDIVCFSALYTILHMTLPISPVYICILILRRRIIARLSYQGVNITKDTKNLHSQLLMALTYQAAIPGFYLFSVASYAIGQFGIYNHPVLELRDYIMFFTFATIFSIAHSVIAILGMSFNILLVYLALFQTPKVIRSYATLIVNFALTDFCACLFDLLVQQRIIPAGLTLGYVSNGVCKYFGPRVCYTLYSLMLHFLAHTLWSLLLSFSYRYYILFRPAPSRQTLIYVLLIIYIPSLIQWISFLYAQSDPQEISIILETRFPEYNMTGSCVTGTKDIVSFAALYTILHMTVPITPVYICILVLRMKIISKLNFQGVNIAKDTKNLHTQLLMSLTYQAALPGFFFFSIVSYALGQFAIYNSPWLEYFTSSGFLLIPFFSPVASFIFVTPYRNFIRNCFYRMAHIEPIESSSTLANAATSNIYIMA